MPSILMLVLLAAVPGHRDWGKIPGQCEACHVGHGIPGMKMAPVGEPDLCLRCHGGAARLTEMVKQGYVSASAAPQDISRETAMPSLHDNLKSCSACHAGHGIAAPPYISGKGPKPGTKRTNQFEYELCAGCHGGNPIFQSPASFHSVRTLPKSGFFPSLKSGGMTARTWINCSDCHGVSDASLPRGVHASVNAHLLKFNDQTLDGQAESASTYAQCYACHDRNSILQNESFSLHQTHIVNGMTSCYSCHDSHAGRTLPHLLAIEDESRNDRISPDLHGRKTYTQTGNLAGVCSLTCHGVNHDGWAYGPKTSLRKQEATVPVLKRRAQDIPVATDKRK